MKSICKTILFAAAVAALVSPALVVSAAAAEEGFKNISNGKDLSGWDGDQKLWSIKDGAITGKTTPEAPLKGNTFLIWTNGTVDDFELRCSYKITPNNDKNFANSGIQYRSKVIDPQGWVVGGYQADFEAGATYSGILYEERMTRGIMAARGEKVVWDEDCKKQVTGSVGKSDEIQAAIKKDEWNDYTIIARGNHFQHFINGKQTVDVTDECKAKRAMSGVLALQLHAGQPMTVQFRNLRLKTLSGGAAADDLKKLQGAWQVVSVEANGEMVPPEQVTNIVVRINDTSYTAELSDRTDRGTFKIDPEKNPRHMDVFPGSSSERVMPAIYEVTEDTFKVCYAQNGEPRPSAFNTANEYGRLFVTYKRKTD